MIKQWLSFIAAGLGISLLYLNCSSSGSGSKGDNLSDRVLGTWFLVERVCGGITFTETGVTEKFIFQTNSYNILREFDNGCKISKTGSWSAGGNIINTSYSQVFCQSDPCTGEFETNGEADEQTCPGDVRIDGKVFATSLDDTTMFLTPQSGFDANCYYKYRR